MVTRLFPAPGRLVEAAYRELHLAAHGTPDQRQAVAAVVLERPWDPPSCSPAVRAQVWQWLDEVAAWVNSEYAWSVSKLIPPCWPAHPHIAHELAVLADLRRAAGLEPSSVLLEDWHRYSLPMFLDRITERLATGCAAGHQDWPAAARYRAFTSGHHRGERAAAFAADLATVRAPTPGGTSSARLAVVDLGSGQVLDPGRPTSGREHR